jgi:hypothetical protein
VAGLLTAVKGLTFTNLMMLAGIVVIAVPAYFIYSLLNDPAVMDRFLSSYSETTDAESGCTLRKVRLRGGPWRWSIATGFAYAGSDRYSVSVILPAEPDADDIASYCATLGLIVDRMLFDADGQPAP